MRLGRVDRCGEAVAHARHRLDVLLAGGLLAQRLPQHRHVVIQVVFLDRRLWPHRVEQLLLRDQPPGILDQHAGACRTPSDAAGSRHRRARDGAHGRRDETARTDTRLAPRSRPRIAPQESFRNMPAFSKDAGGRSDSSLWIARTETARRSKTMPKLLPDQSFYPSPTMAMQAPAETLAYVALLNPDPTGQRRACRAGRRSRIARLRRSDRARRHARHRRRAAPLRLERVQLVPVPVLAAPAHGAALSRRARHALVAHPHPRHQARPAAAAARQGDRSRGSHAEDRLQPAAHRALRAGRHLRQRAGQRGRRRPGRHLRARSRDIRDQGPLGSAIADRSTSRTTSGGTSVTTR